MAKFFLVVVLALATACDDGPIGPQRDRSLGDFALVAIGEPGESYAVAGFNNSGAIAGRLFATSGPDRAFRHLGAGFHTLDLGTTVGWAVAINDSGHVAVNAGPVAAKWRAGLETIDSLPAPLRGAGPAPAADINNAGAVLLRTHSGAAAVAWFGSALDTVGTLQGSFPNYYPSAVILSDSGDAVIHVCDELAKKCFWQMKSERPVPGYASLESCPYGSVFVDRTAPFGFRAALAMNARRDILGRANGINCLWRADGTFEILDIDDVRPSLNNDGWVVGKQAGLPVLLAGGKRFTPFDLVRALDGWTISEFLFVNDARQILARGARDGAWSLLILTPVQQGSRT